MRPLRSTLMCAAAGAMVAGSAAAASGQTPAPDKTGSETSAVTFAMEDHPTLRVGKTLEVRLRARLESSFRRWSLEPDETETDLAWRRRRVQVEGELFKKLEFEVSHEFGDPTEPERDAFVNYRISRRFELQGGRFKMPFGRDIQIGGANLDLVHRSALGRQLAPGRDLGVMVHGRSRGRLLAYQAGYFTHDGDNARSGTSRGGEHAVAGRFLVSPFTRTKARWAEPLRLGVATTRSHLDQVLGLHGRSVFGDGVLFDRAFVNGSRWRLGLESEWERGPISAAAEFASMHDERAAMGLDGEALPSLSTHAWYVSGSWVVTGENKQGRIDPRRGVLQGGPGAVEVAARIERLTLAPPAGTAGIVGIGFLSLPAGNGERVVTLGASWFLHPRMKMQGNLVIEHFDDPARSPVPRANGRLTSAILNLQFVL